MLKTPVSTLICFRKTRYQKIIMALQPQMPAPKFTGTAVINGEFKEISLDDYKGKYVVLFFYPLDFTFVCPTEIIAFNDRAKEFEALNCAVIACSTDSHFSHLAWCERSRKEGGLGEMQVTFEYQTFLILINVIHLDSFVG